MFRQLTMFRTVAHLITTIAVAKHVLGHLEHVAVEILDVRRVAAVHPDQDLLDEVFDVVAVSLAGEEGAQGRREGDWVGRGRRSLLP